MKTSLLHAAFALLAICLFPGCVKDIVQARQDALEDLMASKTWYVSQFFESNTVCTAEFTGYEFQFRKDHTVNAKKGITSVIGDWGADFATKVLSSSFNSGNPLERLNGTWTVYYQDAQGPKLSQLINGKQMKLALKYK